MVLYMCRIGSVCSGSLCVRCVTCETVPRHALLVDLHRKQQTRFCACARTQCGPGRVVSSYVCDLVGVWIDTRLFGSREGEDLSVLCVERVAFERRTDGYKPLNETRCASARLWGLDHDGACADASVRHNFAHPIAASHIVCEALFGAL